MRKSLITVLTVFIAGAAFAATFTDLNSPQYEGKTADKARNTAIDANFAAIEAGTATVTLDTNKLWVGNNSQAQTAMGVQGDVTITQDGTNVTTAIAAGVIVNADVATNAAIALSKLNLGGVTVTQTLVTANSITNIFTYSDGVLSSWTTNGVAVAGD